MHGFSLTIGSLLNDAWAKGIIAQASAVVRYFRASHLPLHTMRAEAEERGITTTLKPSNATRFTSVYECLLSVLQLKVICTS